MEAGGGSSVGWPGLALMLGAVGVMKPLCTLQTLRKGHLPSMLFHSDSRLAACSVENSSSLAAPTSAGGASRSQSWRDRTALWTHTSCAYMCMRTMCMHMYMCMCMYVVHVHVHGGRAGGGKYGHAWALAHQQCCAAALVNAACDDATSHGSEQQREAIAEADALRAKGCARETRQAEPAAELQRSLVADSQLAGARSQPASQQQRAGPHSPACAALGVGALEHTHLDGCSICQMQLERTADRIA